MITIFDKTNCCGCGACSNICPKSCITMQADEEGFLYPKINKKTCINCGLCEKTCPILNKPKTYQILQCYAAKHKNSKIKLKSSSGGIFTALAENILKEGGVVFGAAFDKDWNVRHTFCKNLNDLDKLRRSKYVQSDIGLTYRQTKDFLDKECKVLFTGTPCQIAALRNFLGKEYENLLTAELFCHGVPSPTVWQKFLEENTQKNRIKAIDFRHKRFGWNASFLNITYKNGVCLPKLPFYLKFLEKAAKGLLIRKMYKLSFCISNLYERPACHECYFKGTDRLADFTLGDLWGKWPEIITKEDKKLGISALLVNTPKGQKYWEKIAPSISFTELEIDKVIYFNPALNKPTVAHNKREDFFRRYKTENFNKLTKELLNIKPFPVQLVQAAIKKITRKFKKRNK